MFLNIFNISTAYGDVTRTRESKLTHSEMQKMPYYGTDVECLCCREAGEVPEEYFWNELCITENENFRAVCIHGEVLKTTLRMLNNLRSDEINISNRSMRYAGYRQYTVWVLRLGLKSVLGPVLSLYYDHFKACVECSNLFY